LTDFRSAFRILNMANTLNQVRRATAQRARSEQVWREAIRKAHDQGHSMRAIAEAAELSAARVHQIIKEGR
jgi:hypothetical protein